MLRWLPSCSSFRRKMDDWLKANGVLTDGENTWLQALDLWKGLFWESVCYYKFWKELIYWPVTSVVWVWSQVCGYQFWKWGFLLQKHLDLLYIIFTSCIFTVFENRGHTVVVCCKECFDLCNLITPAIMDFNEFKVT